MSIISLIHAAAGFVGLTSGLAVIITPNKGNNRHKKLGLLYFISMVVSSILAVVVSIQMKHPIFFSIGLFTLYMLFSAYISIPARFVKRKKLFHVLAIIGVASGIYMIYTRIVFMVIFGFLQLLLVLQDFRLTMTVKTDVSYLLRAHAGKMTGSFIAASTAFTVNVIFSGNAWWHWLLPTMLFLPLIIFWNYRFSKKKFPVIKTNV